eukprot:CAMPEP_0119052220 /NCGR_PEP_ID=MMETSP1177-20130426/73586_1 /TAXON_ID=2985 /ORGANISM="Ochromonas sp, Strain CCMP1899" /LENGTH=587 /DNA_ID=CAMNT_0007031719 /DNA_START=259 /DNA_END=2022 /DNA_ORIENTATION=-
MSICASPGCFRAGINRCSICLREPYCSGECQKGDWKSHKLICKTLNKLSLQQPYHEAARVIKEILGERPKKMQLDIRVLEHLISYSEHQFGDRVPGKAYRERKDGDRIDNWTVEIGILIPIYRNLVNINSDGSLSIMDSNNSKLPYHEKMLDLLTPWSSQLDSNPTSQIDSLDKDQITTVLYLLSTTERNTAIILRRKYEFVLSESYCQQALSHARLYQGTEEIKIDLVCSILTAYYELRSFQCNFIDALSFAEEAYNLVAIAYNPVHPKVQEAAGTLIECLMHKDDLYNAERFAESTTERSIATVLRKRNKFELAESYCQQALSHARLYEGIEEQKNDLLRMALTQSYDLKLIQSNFVDALSFAEEAYDLVAIAYNPVHPKVQETAGTLIACLMHKGDLYDAERFAEATLDSLKDPANGLDQESEAVANGYYNLANVIDAQEGDLVKAEMLARESLRIRTRAYGNNHVNVGISCHLLGGILMSQNNLGNKTMELFERSLANDTKYYGPNGTDAAISNFNLGAFYHRLANKQQIVRREIENLRLSKSKFEEAVRIYTKICHKTIWVIKRWSCLNVLLLMILSIMDQM